MAIKNKNDRKIYLVISEIRVNYFEMDKGNFTGSLHINGMIQSMFCVKKPNVIPISFPNEGAFENENTINEKKNKIKISKKFCNMQVKRQNFSTTASQIGRLQQ